MLKEFRENFVGLLALLVVALTIYGLVKLGTRASAAPASKTLSAQSTDTAADQYLFAAVYTTTGGQTSTLGLNNSQNHPITAQVTLYNKHGASLTVPPITLDGHKNHGYDIADWVHNTDGFEEGSIEVFYHDGSMALGAQETITDANHSLSFDVHLQEPMDFMSSRADVLWWGLDDNQAEAEVFIANTRSTQTTVTPTFFIGGVANQGEAITLNGHESHVIDIEKSLQKLHLSTTAIGGISLNYATAGGVAMVGVIRNQHTGFSTTMRFIDQTSQHTTTLHGASILIGKPEANLGFSASTRFTPHVFARNDTNQPVTINPRIRYTLLDQPNTVTLAAATLSANEVRELDLSAAINAIGSNVPSDTGIEIDHNGSPGAVMAYAASIDQNGSNVFDVPIKDPKSEMGFKGGSYPWNIAGDNRAVLHIKSIDAPNDGLKRQAMAKLYFDGGEYNIPLQQMEAGQTVEVDIKKLRDDQVKDILGNVIPTNVTGGQLAWYGRPNKGDFIGRLVEYNPVTGVSGSFSCVGNCLCDPGFFNGLLRPEILLGFSNVAIGPIDAVEIDADCNLANFFTNDISDFGLFSANPDVAAISGHMVTLVGPGTTEITASWDTVTVQQHCIGFASDGECVDAMCPTNNVATPAETQATVRPMITSITPAASAVGHPVTVTLSGSGFAGGASVSAGSGVTVSEITVSSSTSMSATFSVDANAAAGDRDVTVTVNGQTSNSKTFTVQVPDRLSVVSDTGNAPFQNCPNVKGRLITYQILDSSSSHSPIAQALDVAEALDNLTSNTCGNGQPDPSVCESTSSSGQFTDGIAITVNCASAVALSNCASNPSCGYEYTQRWSTCFPEAIIELMSVPGITHCNEIKINNATQLSTGTVMPK